MDRLHFAQGRRFAACVALAFVAFGGRAQTAPPAQPISEQRIAQIVASPDRSAADRSNDQRRKPEQMLAFIGLRPGMVALDVSAGGGYTTELLARAIGPSGVVHLKAHRVHGEIHAVLGKFLGHLAGWRRRTCVLPVTDKDNGSRPFLREPLSGSA